MKSSDSAQGKICLNRLEKGGMALAGTFGQKHGGTAPSAERFNAASALRVQRIAENALRWPDTLQPNTNSKHHVEVALLTLSQGRRDDRARRALCVRLR
jgi:hypothetical protein